MVDKKFLQTVLLVILGGALIWGMLKLKTYFHAKIPKLELNQDLSTSERMKLLDSWLEGLHQSGKFNGGVLISRNSKPLLMKTYGFTDHTLQKTLTPRSSLRLGSVSKQFTAFGIMVLHNNKELHFDDLVTKYIEGFPYDRVSIRHLLNMTSGIPDNYMELAKQHKDEIDPPLSIQKAVQLICKYPYKVSKPNENYSYSNTNYLLLAGIIESVSDRSFEKFMNESVFDVLKMKNTRVWNLLSKDSTFPNMSQGFMFANGKLMPATPTFIDGVSGDNGIFGSLEDFLVWDNILYGNDLITDEVLEEAFKSPVLNDGSTSPYGFGWSLGDNEVSHAGGWLANRAFVSRNIKNKSCIVLLDNSFNSRYFKNIQKALYGYVNTY